MLPKINQKLKNRSYQTFIVIKGCTCCTNMLQLFRYMKPMYLLRLSLKTLELYLLEEKELHQELAAL